MAQVTDRTVGANPSGFDMRTEINNIIAALESDNSGSSAPLNTVAYMKWLDTSNATYYYYKERNHDNTAWVTLFRYTVATKIMEAVSNGVVFDSSSFISKTGNETIAGVKTFSSSPIVPTPTAPTEIANKAYADTKQTNLGFNPVQQGTGIGQLSNAVKIGWSGSRVKVTVDSTDVGNIVMDSNQTSIGVGQTWQDMTASRVIGTNYTNSTGKPISLSMWCIGTAQSYNLTINVNSVATYFNQDYASGAGYTIGATIIIPNGATYSIAVASMTLTKWFELR